MIGANKDNKEKNNSKTPQAEKPKTPTQQGQQEPAKQPELTAEELRDRLLRLGAEFENYKKRVQKEREDLVKYVGESFILELLYIVDNFERAFQAADKTQDFKVLHKGVEMILKEVEEFLTQKGVKKIKVIDEQFDPHRHEAIENVVSPDKPENIIVEELQAGYELNGKVIRPARVKVAKNSPQSTDNSPQ